MKPPLSNGVLKRKRRFLATCEREDCDAKVNRSVESDGLLRKWCANGHKQTGVKQ